MQRLTGALLGALMLLPAVSGPAAAAEEPTEVSIAFDAWPGTFELSPIIIARQMGIDRQHGISFTPVHADKVQDERGMVRDGEVTMASNVYGMRQPDGLVSFATLIGQSGVHVMVPSGSGMQDVQDLGGALVASYGCGEDVGLNAKQFQAFLRNNGMDIACTDGTLPAEPADDTVYLLPMGETLERMNALRDGDVDGALLILTHVYRLQAKAPGEYTALVTPEQINAGDARVTTQVPYTRQSYARQHPEVLRAIVETLQAVREVYQSDVTRARWHIACYLGYLGDIACNDAPARQQMTAALGELSSEQEPVVKAFRNGIIANVPERLCLDAEVVAKAIRFYAGDPNLDLSGHIDQVCPDAKR